MVRARVGAVLAGLAVAVALLLTACGAQRPSQPWSTTLAWGTGVSLGRQPGGGAVGPLSVAAGADVMVLADSFGRRLLVWRRTAGVWRGPVARSVPGRAPIVALGLAPAATRELAVAVDAAGTVWAVPEAGAARELAILPAAAGSLRTVTSLAVAADGTVVVDAVDVGAEHSARVLLAVAPSGAVRLLGAASIARVSAGGASSGLPSLLTAPGVRDGLAACSAGGVWTATRAAAPSHGNLLCLGTNGRVLRRRPLPALRPPADFLGVDREGRAYAVEGVGTNSAALVTFGAHGRARRVLALPPAAGPLLPHPAALAPDGAVVVLIADDAAMRLVRLPAGWRQPIAAALP